jgi:hypothetical protein
MIKRVAAVLAAAVTLGLAGPAWAVFEPPPDHPPGNGSGGSSSGSPKYGHVNNCSIYATSASFGMTCAQGWGRAQQRTVKEVLDGDDPPHCWDERISADDQVAKYGLADAPEGTTYYMHYCVSDIDVNAPVGSLRAMHLNVQILEIPNDAKPCPSPQPPERAGRCIMTLTTNQQHVVELSEPAGGRIPPIVIVPQPATRIRTNQAVAYQNRGGAGRTRSKVFQVGTVRMWAELNRFSIQPYGPTDERITCDGSIRVTDNDSPDSTPRACWFTYLASSARQADQVYPFRAEADWTVYVDAGLGPEEFAHFQKYDDLRLPVYDVQTLVIH